MRDAVILVMFDLPVKTSEQKREYRMFSSGLKKEGYISIQESIYHKYIRNISMAEYEIRKLDKIAPVLGNVIAVPINYNSYKKFAVLRGETPDLSFLSNNIITL